MKWMDVLKKIAVVAIGGLIALPFTIAGDFAKGALCKANGVDDVDGLVDKIFDERAKKDVVDTDAEEVEE